MKIDLRASAKFISGLRWIKTGKLLFGFLIGKYLQLLAYFLDYILQLHGCWVFRVPLYVNRPPQIYIQFPPTKIIKSILFSAEKEKVQNGSVDLFVFNFHSFSLSLVMNGIYFTSKGINTKEEKITLSKATYLLKYFCELKEIQLPVS